MTGTWKGSTELFTYIITITITMIIDYQGDPELPATPALLAGQLGGGDRRRWRVWKPSCSSNQAGGRLRQCAGKIFMEYICQGAPCPAALIESDDKSAVRWWQLERHRGVEPGRKPGVWIKKGLMGLLMQSLNFFFKRHDVSQVWGARAVEYWLVDDQGPAHLGSLEVPVNKQQG